MPKQKIEKPTHDQDLWTINTLLSVAAFGLLLLIQNFLGRAVFEKVKMYKQEYYSHPLSTDSLMSSRFGLDYVLPKYLTEFMKPVAPVLLAPPAGYIKKYLANSSSFSLTNPIYMFYMNSAVQIVSLDSPRRNKANCAVLIDQNGQLYPMKITSSKDLELVVQLFESGQPYKPMHQDVTK
jgi:hypothetical protein